MNPQLDLTTLYNYLKTKPWYYSKLLWFGYKFECYALPNYYNKRFVGGLEETFVENKDLSLIIKFKPEYTIFAILIFVTEYINLHDNISGVYLGKNRVDTLTFEDIIINKENYIKLQFNSWKAVEESQNSIYYIISPFLNDTYYRDKILESWTK